MNADEIAARMTMTSLDQLRVIADPYRLNILRILRGRAATVKMLADQLGDVPGKVHYHVRELERLGFIRLVSKQEKGGVIEKYYRVVAYNFEPEAGLLRIIEDTGDVPHHVKLTSRVRDEFITVADQRLREEQAAESGTPDTLVSFDVGEQFYLTEEQVRELHSFITTVLEDARKSGNIAGADKQQYTIGLFIYPTPDKATE